MADLKSRGGKKEAAERQEQGKQHQDVRPSNKQNQPESRDDAQREPLGRQSIHDPKHNCKND